MRPGPDDVEIVDIGPSAPPPVDPAAAPRRRWLPVALLAVLAAAGTLTVLVLHTPAQRHTATAAPATHPSALPTLPSGEFSCDNPGDCIISPSATPTSGVAAALHAHFPTAAHATAQLYLDPASGKVRSQYVIATTPTGVRVTVAVSYDGDIFQSGPTYHRDFDHPPTLFFDRHTYSGWAVEVTVGGTPAAEAHQKDAYALVSDPRLLG